MDILGDRYLPADTALEIALRVPPKNILNFCRTTKTMHSICNRTSFWIKYVNNDQEKYNKLIMELVKKGEFEVFKRLWAREGDVISEPKLLEPAFEVAYLNGHEDFANYLYFLNEAWKKYKNILSQGKIRDSIKLSAVIKDIYDYWYNVVVDNEDRTLITVKLELSLKEAVKDDDVEQAKIILKLMRKSAHRPNINTPLSYSKSIELFNELKKYLRKRVIKLRLSLY